MSVLAATAHPDWLFHILTVSGPALRLAAFRARAQGAAAIPWQLDLHAEEQRLLAPMAAAGPAARVLARELREAVAAHHDRVLAQIARGNSCPLDLHRLVAVPQAVLARGPDDPASLRWLWEHWGTLQPLRHVRILDPHPDRRLRRAARVTFDFFAADWTPWQAIRRMRADWPELIFDIRPRYDDG
jgi:hypothetical protein